MSTDATHEAPDLAAVRRAAARLAGRAHRTPVVTCASLDERAGRRLFFKCEQLQKVGAFKYRGAANAVACLDPEIAARGVVTHSSGNHAQALALAAREAGIPAHIVMPSTASAVKRRAVVGYGAHVVTCEPNQAARERAAARLLSETGGTLVPPYDHPDVIAGQGTVALELLEQVPDLQAIVAPIGGGGLVSGIGVAAHGVDPAQRLVAAEPAGADDARRSLEQGRLVPQSDPQTLCDGLLTSLGDWTWPLVREHVERVLTVDDDAIVSAMRLAWERAKLLIEPSSAVALAVALSEEFAATVDVDKVGIVLSGGNVDLDNLPW